jgi:hypothetical protein
LAHALWSKNGQKRQKTPFFKQRRFLSREYGREWAANLFLGVKHLGTRENRMFDFSRSKAEFGGIFE